MKRVIYATVTDNEALEAFHLLNRKEGIPAALESAHAVARAIHLAKLYLASPDSESTKPYRILVNLSGRGDKDLDRVSELSSQGDSSSAD
jgi:tryptophan synthase beta chain